MAARVLRRAQLAFVTAISGCCLFVAVLSQKCLTRCVLGWRRGAVICSRRPSRCSPGRRGRRSRGEHAVAPAQRQLARQRGQLLHARLHHARQVDVALLGEGERGQRRGEPGRVWDRERAAGMRGGLGRFPETQHPRPPTQPTAPTDLEQAQQAGQLLHGTRHPRNRRCPTPSRRNKTAPKQRPAPTWRRRSRRASSSTCRRSSSVKARSSWRRSSSSRRTTWRARGREGGLWVLGDGAGRGRFVCVSCVGSAGVCASRQRGAAAQAGPAPC